MNKCLMPHRITLWKNGHIDYGHILSDGYGIPAVVIGCPLRKNLGNMPARMNMEIKLERLALMIALSVCSSKNLDLDRKSFALTRSNQNKGYPLWH